MINKEQTISCPVCKNAIHFDTYQLLSGIQFVCSNCSAAIGLSLESKDVVESSMEKLKKLKL